MNERRVVVQVHTLRAGDYSLRACGICACEDGLAVSMQSCGADGYRRPGQDRLVSVCAACLRMCGVALKHARRQRLVQVDIEVETPCAPESP